MDATLMAFPRAPVGAHFSWDITDGLALDRIVAVLSELVPGQPLTTLATWLRWQPQLQVLFAEPEGPIRSQAPGIGLAPCP